MSRKKQEYTPAEIYLWGSNGHALVSLTVRCERDPEAQFDGNPMAVELLHIVDGIYRVLIDEANIHAARIAAQWRTPVPVHPASQPTKENNG